MRTFVAIDLESEIKKNIAQFVKLLERHNSSVRWIKERGMHLTLKFIGEIAEDKAQTIRLILRDLSSRHERFPLKLVGTGTFPPRSRHPRILWIGIEENRELMAVQDNVESILEKVSVSREKRRFSAHLTLGRVKSSHNIAPLLEELSVNKTTEFGCMEVGEITFFKSTLKPTGAEYAVLEKIPLK